MSVIPVDKTPVVINGQNIVEFKVRDIFMMAFHKLALESNSAVPNGGKPWTIHNKRLRMKNQVRAVTDAGTELTLDDMAITQLPRVYAGALTSQLGRDDSEPGEIINTGDGISSPILYRLGTPILVQANNEASAITELEFIAHTYGDVEEVLAENDQLSQTVALIKSVAKPLGVNDTLQRLPQFALDKFALADCFKIMEVVLPRFLD